MKHNLKSYILVALQFVLIGFVVLYGGVFGGIISNMVTFLALALGLWAVTTMRLRVSVFPEVMESQKLYTGGPYRFLRHPMYAAVLLAVAVWVSHRADVFSLAAWVALFLVFVLKIKIEEKELAEKFPEYREYQKRTKKLIPGVY